MTFKTVVNMECIDRSKIDENCCKQTLASLRCFGACRYNSLSLQL